LQWLRASALSNYAWVSVLGNSEISPDELNRATNYSLEAVGIAESIKNPWLLAHILMNRGMVLKYEGKDRRDVYLKTLSIRYSIRDYLGLLQSLERLADVMIETSQFRNAAVLFGAESAIERISQARLPRHHESDHKANEGLVRERLGIKKFARAFERGSKTPLDRVIDAFTSQGSMVRRRLPALPAKQT
jgi:hypothetical protein